MKKRVSLSTSHIIMLGFLAVIAIGSLLLWLPISAADGQAVSYADALFTATTATCVTGLVTLPTVSTWSVFGQVVILLLIQIGGLGVVTVMAGLMMALHRRIGLSDRLLIQDAFNLNSLSGLTRFVRKVLIGTAAIEGVGALLCLPVFLPRFGAKGIWIAVFHSVSAFCNAGIDIFATDSLCGYATHPLLNAVTATLIVLGGIGYIVWWDVLRVLPTLKRQGLRGFRNLTLHSKLALWVTAALLLGGAVGYFLLEYRNPLTIGNLNLFDKIQVSLFQSVTTRTAGFASVPQENLTDASVFLSLLLMFVGGSPVGTAGGVKTVTVFILLASAFATIKNKSDTVLFRRTVSKAALGKALAVVCMSFLIVVASTLLLSTVTDAPLADILYETVSATATVGLSRNLTSSLELWGKLIVIATMYLGRIGPISLAVAFNVRSENHNIIKDPVEDVRVG